MSIEAGLVIAMLGLICTVVATASAQRRNTRADAQKEAVDMTTLVVKLENINNGVMDIKRELRDVREDAQELRERLVSVEGSAKQAHKRLDEHIKG